MRCKDGETSQTNTIMASYNTVEPTAIDEELLRRMVQENSNVGSSNATMNAEDLFCVRLDYKST